MKKLLTVATLIAAVAAHAQSASRQIGYHGALGRVDGGTVTGNTSMTFALYGAASGGTAVWSETKMVSMNAGNYATLLGDTTALPVNIFDGRALFLEVSITEGTTTTTLIPRQPVAAAPYSLGAHNVTGGTVNASSATLSGPLSGLNATFAGTVTATGATLSGPLNAPNANVADTVTAQKIGIGVSGSTHALDVRGSVRIGDGGYAFSGIRELVQPWDPASLAGSNVSTYLAVIMPDNAHVISVTPPLLPAGACPGGFGCSYDSRQISALQRFVVFNFNNSSGATYDAPLGNWSILYIVP